MIYIEISSVCPEPEGIKAQILEDMKHLEKEFKNIRVDTMALWYENKLPSYLWKTCNWGDALKTQGFTWQKFLNKMKYKTEDALHWVKGDITWEEFINSVYESIKK